MKWTNALRRYAMKATVGQGRAQEEECHQPEKLYVNGKMALKILAFIIRNEKNCMAKDKPCHSLVIQSAA